MPKRLLLLFAHPNQHQSRLNRSMFELAQKHPAITCVDLYGCYPNGRINVAQQQQLLLNHDIVMFQFPLYWYSTPAILKQWQDWVLEFGFAYGDGGDALKGKYFICALTAGAKASAYQVDGVNQHPIADFLLPLKQMSHLCQMHWLPHFEITDARAVMDSGTRQAHLSEWQRVLDYLSSDDSHLLELGTKSPINELISR